MWQHKFPKHHLDDSMQYIAGKPLSFSPAAFIQAHLLAVLSLTNREKSGLHCQAITGVFLFPMEINWRLWECSSLLAIQIPQPQSLLVNRRKTERAKEIQFLWACCNKIHLLTIKTGVPLSYIHTLQQTKLNCTQEKMLPLSNMKWINELDGFSSSVQCACHYKTCCARGGDRLAPIAPCLPSMLFCCSGKHDLAHWVW